MILPDAPNDPTPLLKLIYPDEPFAPDFDVDINILPLDVALPTPEERKMDPPELLPDLVVPPLILTEPPTDASPSPTDKTMDPPLPPDALPDTTFNEPDDPAWLPPEESKIAPLKPPRDPILLDFMTTSPEFVLLLVPLNIDTSPPVSAPEPLIKEIEPPEPTILAPAFKEILPLILSTTSPSPTFNTIEPPLPDVALELSSTILPDDPDDPLPVLKLKYPDDPLVPALAVYNFKLPLDVPLPTPELKNIDPPELVDDVDTPALIKTEPPTFASPCPTDNTIEPPLPPDALPVTKRNEPDDPTYVSPDERFTDPLNPSFLPAVLDFITISPELDELLPPLDTVTLPPLFAPVPPLNIIEPPKPAAFEPAAKEIEPPLLSTISPDPTIIEIEPPLFDMDFALLIKIFPEDPDELEPLPNIKYPDEPALSAFADFNIKFPLDDVFPAPEVKYTDPPEPVVDVDKPPFNIIEPPSIESLSPLDNNIEPLAPPDDKPVIKRIDPDEPAWVVPEDNEIEPLTPPDAPALLDCTTTLPELLSALTPLASRISPPDIAPLPLCNNIDPPLPAIFVPALRDIFPPLVVLRSPEPTRTDIEPPLPEVALALPIKISPDDPENPLPVFNFKYPDEPLVPPLAVFNTMLPLEVTLPIPDVTYTDPPESVGAVDAPAFTEIEPPDVLSPCPTDKSIEPPRPPEAEPVTKLKEPEEPSFVLPLDNTMNPLPVPKSLASLDFIITLPELVV
jgi:hypothetical protein